ncbi:MAG: hypothetical protein ACRC10_07570 [Thermoguttaceae bacterium]
MPRIDTIGTPPVEQHPEKYELIRLSICLFPFAPLMLGQCSFPCRIYQKCWRIFQVFKF